MKQENKRKWLVEPVQSHYSIADIVERWSLDNPAHGAWEDNSPDVNLYGWALGKGEMHQNLHVVLQTKEGTWSHPLDSSRPDVVKTLLGKKSAEQRETVCGFLHHLPKGLFTDGAVTLGFETEGIIHPVVQIRLVDEVKPTTGPRQEDAAQTLSAS
jgi:hypothetical protein